MSYIESKLIHIDRIDGWPPGCGERGKYPVVRKCEIEPGLAL